MLLVVLGIRQIENIYHGDKKSLVGILPFMEFSIFSMAIFGEPHFLCGYRQPRLKSLSFKPYTNYSIM